MNKEIKKGLAIASICNNKLSAYMEPTSSLNARDVLIESDLGIRIYRDTLCLLFETAVNDIFKFEHNLRIVTTIGDAYFYVFKDGYVPSTLDVENITAEMDNLVESRQQIEEIETTYDKAIIKLKACKLNLACRLLGSLSPSTVKLTHVLSTYKVSSAFVLKNFKDITSFELKKYQNGFLLRFPRKGEYMVKNDWKDNPILYNLIEEETKEDSEILSINSLGMLNELVSSNNIKSYIELSENLQRRKIMKAAEEINKRGGVKVVFIAGPSSSNKTTFANKLTLELKLLGYQPISISLDDYYFTKDKVPKNEKGQPDVECLESIDIGLFREHLKTLYQGGQVFLPHFEFNFNKIGRRTFSNNAIQLEKNSILIVEGIHALNLKIAEGFEKDSIFKIYISPLLQLNLDEYNRIRSTDLRILRRLVRDFRTRNASALETLSMWDDVEKGERKNIFPYQNEADLMINSAHSYEIAVLLIYAVPLLRSVKPSDDLNSYIAARRLLHLLYNINPIPSRLVPKESMLREFIGD